MSITVNLKKISNLPGRCDRKVELCFRGFTHKTRALQCENLAVFNEHFRWPHYGKVVRDEVLSISVYNCSKVFSNRLLGKLVVSLQHVVTAGRLLLREPLTDGNYSLTDIYIELDIRYHPVEGTAGGWEGQDFLKVEDKDDSALVIRNDGFDDPESQLTVTRPGQLDKEVRRLGRSLVRTGDEDEDEDDDDFDDDDLMDLEASDIIFTPLLSRFRPMSRNVAAGTPRVQSFQTHLWLWLYKDRTWQRSDHTALLQPPPQNTATAASSGMMDESGEAGVEVPEAVTVEVEEIHPLPEGFLGQREEFLLFASLFEVTMMDPSVGTRPVAFELSIGNNGKAVGVGRSKKSQSREELRRSREELRRSREELNEEVQGLLESEEELDREEVLSPEPEIRSVTAATRPQPTEYDRSFQCIPLQPPSEKQKPCLFIWSQFEDHSFRLYQANWLSKTADRLEIGLDEVERLMRRPKSNAKERLVEVLLELVASCKQFNVIADRRSQSRPNNLDRCRKEFIKKNLVFVARQAVRARRRITRRTTKQRLMEGRKLLRKLRLLAKEPQTTLPDAFLWLLSGSKRLAYVRIPAYSILFSLVEEQRGRDCGRLTTLYMKSPGSSASEIFAKLEVYLWLGLAKYSKEATGCLPDEFMPVYEEEEEERRLVPAGRRKLPVSLSCQDSRYFQLRCHLYQGRGLMAADDNGLSDPFLKVVFSTQCQVTRVLYETLSPAWCECLLFDRVLLEGTREELQQDPPLITITVYDHNSMGVIRSLGRAFAEPEIKSVEQYYQKPRLRFYDISMGRVPAGELLAAFELIELDYSGFGEPCIPSSVDPQELTYLEEQSCYIIPEGVRPVLRTFRIEVLFWGLRDLKRVQLFEVERPKVMVECAGQQLESEEMESYSTHSNFKELVLYMDVELPEQAYLHPPLTVFVVEHRAFGRLALVGTHVVQSLMDYGPHKLGEEEDDEDDEPKPKVKQNTKKTDTLMSMKRMGLSGLSVAQSKIPINPIKLVNAPLKKLIKGGEDLEEEPPEKEELDWWSKYYASLEEMEKQAAEAEMEEMEEHAETVFVLKHILELSLYWTKMKLAPIFSSDSGKD
ncbi:fer-1-like protein 4 [Plectropomus leopardus]|uniref:fer-1-like protein 4 n=1 Tax=Plectropomus leopardus TaxID=160734 RepID=UPI001C4C0BBA|nr:fer-1-like protein 4 [Plectropomus leopardus]